MQVVKFVKGWRSYQPGETAGFGAGEAADLVKAGVARYPEALSGGDQGAEVAVSSLPGEIAREDQIFGIMLNLPEDAAFTKAGLPEVDAINANLPEGFEPVTAEERNAVWKRVQEAVVASTIQAEPGSTEAGEDGAKAEAGAPPVQVQAGG